MWFWCGTYTGLWWIFPIMFILCVIMTFVCMRAFSAGRLCCCERWRGSRTEDGRHRQEKEARGTDREKGE